MRLVKYSDKWGVVLFGTAKVLTDKNNNVVSETEPNPYGGVKLKFKAMGACRQSDKPDVNGTFRWHKQRCWFSIDKDDALAPIVQNLDAGDKIWVFGTLKKSEWTGNDGQIKRNLFCSIEDIRIIAKADGTTANTAEVESQDDINDDIYF